MRRATVFLTAAVLVVSCTGQKGGKKEGAGRKEQPRQTKTARSNPVPVVAAPAPLPKAGPDGVATAFPKVVAVPAPQAAAVRLQAIETQLVGKDYKQRNAARKQLSDLVKEYKGKGRDAMILARHLISRKSIELVNSGVSLLRTLRSQPEFVAVAVSLMGHPSDRIRSSALSLVSHGLKADQVAQVMPFVKKLVEDKSCVVRRTALVALTTNRRKLPKAPVAFLKKALDDACPAVRAYAMRNVDAFMPSVAPKAQGAKAAVDQVIVGKLMSAAEKSPYYLERCAALMGLGRLKVKKAEKLMAKALDMAALPSLVVYYQSERIPYTFSNHSSMPACAADALTALTGKRFPGRPLDRVKAWKIELAKKHLSKKPPKGFCLGGRDCKKGEEVCLNMRCVPNSKAVKAYWKYQEAHHCVRHDRLDWTNFVGRDRIDSGFGLHWNAEWQLRKYLRTKDPKGYAAKHRAIESKPCPGQAEGKAHRLARNSARARARTRARARAR